MVCRDGCRLGGFAGVGALAVDPSKLGEARDARDPRVKRGVDTMLGKRRLNWIHGVAMVGGVLVAARPAIASDLDPKTGSLVSTDPGSILIGFEDAAQLSKYGVALTKNKPGYPPTLTFVDAGGTPMTAAELTAHAASDPAVEGSRALLLGKGAADAASGVIVPFAKLASAMTKPQVRVTVWVRSYGAMPLLTATYSTSALPAAGSFTAVNAIRTGRETSDGWAELTTGPIDTSIWGVPLVQISVGLSSRSTNASLVIDALEITPVDGTPVPAAACTIATQDTACGPDGECQFGHCLPAYASWGPVPSQRHREDFVDRWITLAKNVQAARNASSNADAMIAARPALTAPTVGGRAFYAGMSGLVNGLRNHHTSFGGPINFGTLQPLASGVSSSTLGACLGFGELNLLEDPGATAKKLGFIVYQAAKSSLLGQSLKPGDAVTKIDGIDPLAWVRSVWLTYAPGVPADPGADLAWSATSVAWMISHRASTVEITQCASPTDCTGANRNVLEIDVAAPAWKNLQGRGLIGNENDPNLLDCVERFQDTVTPSASASSSYNDTISSGTVFGDTLGMQFDGTMADFATWQGQVTAAFDTKPTKVLFDVRQGNGGYAEDSEIIAEEIRSATQPIGDVGFYVASWDGKSTVADLLSTIGSASPSCELVSSRSGAPCDGVVEDYFLGDYYAQVNPIEAVPAFTANGLGARVAWLQAADVSANDYLAAFIEGRTNQRVFAPGPTSGSYGTISSTSALLLAWRGGSIQMSDSLWGTSLTDMANKTFRSGVGVAPDEIVAETMSDAMTGVDTMIAAARAWLESGTTTATLSLNVPKSRVVTPGSFRR